MHKVNKLCKMWRKLRINPHYLNTPRGWRICSVISLSLEQIEVFVQNENPIAGETSNFFKNTDFLHFFDKDCLRLPNKPPKESLRDPTGHAFEIILPNPIHKSKKRNLT